MVCSSIKTKMTLAVFVLTVIIMSATTMAGLLFFQNKFKENIARDQFSLLNAVATQIDDRIFDALVNLDTIADTLTPAMIEDARLAQELLDHKKNEQAFFDNSFLLFSRSGRLIAASPRNLNFIGKDYSFRGYFRDTIRTGKICISPPFPSIQKKSQPIVIFTSPVYGPDGKIIAVLGGIVGLKQQHYLRSLAALKLGQNGFLSLYDNNRTTLMHPSNSRLLQLEPAGTMVDKALSGEEGSAETRTVEGIPILRSVKRLQSTDWVLAISYPLKDAYAPIYAARKYFLAGSLVAALLSVLVVWPLMKYLTRPLLTFIRHLEELPSLDGLHQPVLIDTNDEIGVLAQTFNMMMRELDKRKGDLEQQKEFAERLVLNSSLPTFVVDREHRILFWNRACEELTGVKAAEVVGTDQAWKAFYRRKHPLLADAVIDGSYESLPAHYKSISRSSLVPNGWRCEGWYQPNDGSPRFVLADSAPLFNGKGEVIAAIEMIQDITELKQAELTLRESEERYRLLFEHNPNPMFVCDSETMAYLAVNDAATRHYGYSSEEFLNMTAIDIRPPEDVPAFRARFDNAAEGIGHEGVWRHVKKDGTVIHVEITVDTLRFGGRGAKVILAHDVTERKLYEETLRQSEKRYRSIFDGVGDVIFSITPDSSFVAINHAFEQVTGWSREKWLGNSFTGIIHPDDLPFVREIFETTLGGASVPSFEFRVVTSSGESLLLEGSVTPQMAGGKVTTVMGIARDITERKKNEEKRAYLQRRLSAMWNIARMVNADFQSLYDTIHMETIGMTQSRDGIFASVNEETCQMTIHAWSGETVNGCPVKDKSMLVLPLPGAGIWAELMRTRKPVVVNDYHDFADKRELPEGHADLARFAIIPVVINDRIVAVSAVANKATDYTEDDIQQIEAFVTNVMVILDKKRAEDFLLKLSHAVEQSPVSVVITDAEGMIEFANPKYTELTGFELDEVIGKRPSIINPELNDPQEIQKVWKVISSGRVWNGIFGNKKKNGEQFWQAATISPIKDAEGNITNFTIIKEDITERKKLEEQLMQAQKMEAIGTLAGGIAHDFNNIITAIVGYASLVQQKVAGDGLCNQYIEQVLAAGERAAKLTHSLLAYSRKQIGNPEPVDLNEVVKGSAHLLGRLIPESINFRTNLPDNPLMIVADSGQIDQVLMNLVANARDALGGTGDLRITTEAVQLDETFVGARQYGIAGPYALLTVADTGGGMDETTKERIFEPFFTTKGIGKGTGLGLAMVYGIVKQHNGYIDCDSRVGHGTTFRIYLPLIGAAPKENAKPAEQVPVGGNETVLLVEDDGAVRELTASLLELAGYVVISAVDGEDGVRKFHDNMAAIDLIVLDTIMPKLNGIEVSRKVFEVMPNMRIIFMSGYTGDIMLMNMLINDYCTVLPKPLRPNEFLHKVREVLDAP